MKVYKRTFGVCLLFFSLHSANVVYASNPLIPFVEKESLADLQNYLNAHPDALQSHKDEALCLMCSACPREDTQLKLTIIRFLLEHNASKVVRKSSRTPLGIVECHKVWYQQKGIYEDLVDLLKE